MDYLLSLIIPTYNCAPYLSETLASVLNGLIKKIAHHVDYRYILNMNYTRISF